MNLSAEKNKINVRSAFARKKDRKEGERTKLKVMTGISWRGRIATQHAVVTERTKCLFFFRSKMKYSKNVIKGHFV